MAAKSSPASEFLRSQLTRREWESRPASQPASQPAASSQQPAVSGQCGQRRHKGNQSMRDLGMSTSPDTALEPQKDRETPRTSYFRCASMVAGWHSWAAWSIKKKNRCIGPALHHLPCRSLHRRLTGSDRFSVAFQYDYTAEEADWSVWWMPRQGWTSGLWFPWWLASAKPWGSRARAADPIGIAAYGAISRDLTCFQGWDAVSNPN